MQQIYTFFKAHKLNRKPKQQTQQQKQQKKTNPYIKNNVTG